MNHSELEQINPGQKKTHGQASHSHLAWLSTARME